MNELKKGYSPMYRKLLVVLLSVTLLFSPLQMAFADDQVKASPILVIQGDAQASDQVNFLRLLLQHFTDEVDVIKEEEITDLKQEAYAYVFYYSDQQEKPKDVVAKWLTDYSNTFIHIGWQAEHFSPFKDLTYSGDVQISDLIDDEETIMLDSIMKLPHYEVDETYTPLLDGKKGESSYHVAFKRHDTYLLAFSDIKGSVAPILAELLHDIIENDHQEKHDGYIQLTDIHPQSDPEQVKASGEYLLKEGIPFSLTITPVHVDVETGRQKRLSEAGDLVDVLVDLQEAGAAVVVHGYTGINEYDLYEDSTEFWNERENNYATTLTDDDQEQAGPITTEADQSAVNQQRQEKEMAYAKERLTESINELVDQELYPLAVKIPESRMSQSGYVQVGEMFTSLFGAYQLSDFSSEVVTTPYETQIGNLTFFPETLSDEIHFDSGIKQAANEFTRDGVFGLAIPVTLEEEQLKAAVRQMKSIPDVSWLDLKHTEQLVQTEKTEIMSDETGDMTVIDDRKWYDELFDFSSFTFVEKVLWVVALVVLLTVCLFLIITLYLRTQLKKRLFKERKDNG